MGTKQLYPIVRRVRRYSIGLAKDCTLDVAAYGGGDAIDAANYWWSQNRLGQPGKGLVSCETIADPVGAPDLYGRGCAPRGYEEHC